MWAGRDAAALGGRTQAWNRDLPAVVVPVLVDGRSVGVKLVGEPDELALEAGLGWVGRSNSFGDGRLRQQDSKPSNRPGQFHEKSCEWMRSSNRPK